MADSQGRASFRQSLVDALATPELRRVQLGWTGASVGGWGFFIVLAVYAYNEGGAAAVGVAALARMLPAGLAAPLAGVIVDRRSRRDVLVAITVGRALVLVGIAAAVAADAPLAVVLALGAGFTALATAHKPAQAALLPALAETPRQIAASNAVLTAVDSAGFLAGSLLGGGLVAAASIETAFLVTTGIFAVAAWPLARIARDPIPPHREQEEEVEQAFEELASGFRAVARDPSLRLLAGLSACSTFVEGAVDVLVVLVAIELLDLGDAGVGWLNGAWAVGGIVGGAAAISLLGRGRLAAGLAGGCLFVGIPLLLMAALPGGGVAGGVGPTPRVGGSGAAIPEYAFTLLRSVPIFAPLSIGTLENISCRLSEMDVPAGQAVVREGQAGDRFYVIAEGEFDVSCLGGSFPSLADGDVFGEIALLRDVPRTATVTARTDGRVFALDRDAFLTAVGGHRFSARTVDKIASERAECEPSTPLV